MTDDEINVAVAKKFGWGAITPPDLARNQIFYTGVRDGVNRYRLPDYCCDIREAWEIVDKIKNENPRNIVRLEFWDGFWNCQFLLAPEEKAGKIAKANHVPRAICLAFLDLP